MMPLNTLMSLVGLLIAIVSAGCETTSPSGNPPQNTAVLAHNDAHLAQLAWLTGSWINETEKGRSEEHWTTADGGTMLGVNRTVSIRDGVPRTAFYEYLRIENSEKGIVYLAGPLGRHPPTPFHMVSSGEHEVTFENPEHDFPQRIIYRRVGDQLFGTIEGEVDGEVRVSQWSWQRARLTSE